jgi:hypothetical protein
MSIFDYVFCWLGNTNLILSIIKLIEDQMNIEHDINEAGVQMILLVEDNIRFYSSVLPNLYNYILEQSKNFSTEALNPHAAAQRKRGRPKVVLATTYEEAINWYEMYHNNVLGVISDTRFPMQGTNGRLAHVEEGDPEAGLKLLREIHRRDEYVPLILQSSEIQNKAKAFALLKTKLYDLEMQKAHDAESEARRSQIGSGDRSEKVRTYNFPQGRVTDHRIKLTLHKLDQVMDGDLDEIIDSLTAADQAAKLAKMNEA